MLDMKWEDFKKCLEKCAACRDNTSRELIDNNARPLFGKFRPISRGLLFVFEAPNRDDTYNPSKGYITVNAETDPSGTFLYELANRAFGCHPETLQIVNSVLCLPTERNGDRPVSGYQRRLCTENLRQQITILDPTVVVPLGVQPLKALDYVCQHGLSRISEGVAKSVKWMGRWLFPLYHTSKQARYGPTGRKPERQHSDWSELRKFTEDLQEYEHKQHLQKA